MLHTQDIDTSLVKLLAEEKSNSLIPYIENHELYLAFEETKNALEKYSVSISKSELSCRDDVLACTAS